MTRKHPLLMIIFLSFFCIPVPLQGMELDDDLFSEPRFPRSNSLPSSPLVRRRRGMHAPQAAVMDDTDASCEPCCCPVSPCCLGSSLAGIIVACGMYAAQELQNCEHDVDHD